MENVAVIIPVYNVTSFLNEALCSVIAQDQGQQEIIVVDDGSAPEHEEEIKNICGCFRGVTLLRQPHKGAAAARETGVLSASADFILFLDADDILMPGALSCLAGTLRRHPEAVAAYAKRASIDEQGKRLDKPAMPIKMETGADVLYRLLQKKGPFCNGSVCIRKSTLKEILPCNRNLKLDEDWVLWCYLALSGTIIPAGEQVVLHIRRHDKNTGVLLAYTEPHLLFESYNAVFNNASFMDAVGEAAFLALKKKGESVLHAYAASVYATQQNLGRAKFHLKKINLIPSDLTDRGKLP